jgi:hypothetical protein
MIAQLTPGSLSIWQRVQDRLAAQRAEEAEDRAPAVPPEVMRTTMQQQPVQQAQRQKTPDDQKHDPKPDG